MRELFTISAISILLIGLMLFTIVSSILNPFTPIHHNTSNMNKLELAQYSINIELVKKY